MKISSIMSEVLLASRDFHNVQKAEAIAKTFRKLACHALLFSENNFFNKGLALLSGLYNNTYSENMSTRNISKISKSFKHLLGELGAGRPRPRTQESKGAGQNHPTPVAIRGVTASQCAEKESEWNPGPRGELCEREQLLLCFAGPLGQPNGTDLRLHLGHFFG